MIKHKIQTMTGDMLVQHFESGTHMSSHCVKIYINDQKAILTTDGVKDLIDKLEAELPTEFDPDGFRNFLIGKSVIDLGEDEDNLVKIALKFDITWEELRFVVKGSKEAEEAKNGCDEYCLNIEYADGYITDVYWG